eukprot:1783850-Prymnesium_polylepis.1
MTRPCCIGGCAVSERVVAWHFCVRRRRRVATSEVWDYTAAFGSRDSALRVGLHVVGSTV